MVNQDRAALLNEYRKVVPDYQQIEPIALKMIQDMTREKQFFLMTVQSRIKAEKSFSEKLVRKAETIHSIEDVTDLLGLRIICYFSDDVDRICKGLMEIFDLDFKHSVDKRKMLAATQFGYMAVHCICSLKKDSGYPDKYCGRKFEIQVKTVLQHAWAEIEHDLGYKSEFGIPEELRRRFSMSAGLMELGDREFLNLRDSSVQYAEHVHELISRDETDDIPINVVSLREFMKSNRRMLLLYDRILEECGVEVIHADNSYMTLHLDRLHLESLGELSKLAEQRADQLIDELRKDLTERGLDIVSDNQILRLLLTGIDGSGE